MRRQGGTAGPRIVAAIAATAVAAVVGAAVAGAQYGSLLAPNTASGCPNQRDITLAPRVQKKAMRCLHRWARAKDQVPVVKPNPELAQAAQAKARDIFNCTRPGYARQSFSHKACGHPRFYWPAQKGYTPQSPGCYALAENIAWGSDGAGSARATMRAWLNSDPHRSNILRSRFRDIGVGLRHGTFKGQHNSQVWVVILGRRWTTCPARR